MTRIEQRIEEYRQGNACIEVRDAGGRVCPGAHVSVEQENHAFPFGCIVAPLDRLADGDRRRYQYRLGEVFNRVVPRDLESQSDPGAVRVDVADLIHLGLLQGRLDRLAASGLPLNVHVFGQAVGMALQAGRPTTTDLDIGKRLTALYTFCFGHPAVHGVYWNGFADGENPGGGGLLRHDLAPKHAHKVLCKLIGMVWHSRASGLADDEGHFRFRGFLGDYRVVTRVGSDEPVVSTLRASAFAMPPESMFSGGAEFHSDS